MAVSNDQFEHSRIPLRPLAYKNKALAQTDELLIDFGKNGDETYHMFIADSNDPTKFIDLTELMVQSILPTATFSVDNFDITLEGVDEPSALKDVINFIYKRFLYPENYGIFDYSNDSEKMFDESTINTLLRDAEGRVVLPVTFADNVFFKNGKTIQDTYNTITRFAINRQTMYAVTNVDSYEFEYPYPDYMDDVDVRLAGIYLDKASYSITPILRDDNTFSYGTLRLLTSFNQSDQIDLVFTYNSKAYEDVKYDYMSGTNISIKSMPSNRLEKTSDSFTNDDDTSVATSKAVNNLYKEMIEVMGKAAKNTSYNMDISDYDDFIHIDSDEDIVNQDFYLINVLLGTKKRFDCTGLIKYNNDSVTGIPIVDACGKELTKGLPAGKIAKLMWRKETGKLYLISTDMSNLRTGRWIHKSLESETVISYSGMQYDIGACITIYKNGLRLFEDIDYYIDTVNETITLFDPTTEGDTVIFEALYV